MPEFRLFMAVPVPVLVSVVCCAGAASAATIALICATLTSRSTCAFYRIYSHVTLARAGSERASIWRRTDP